MKNCGAKCDARIGAKPIYLWLRNNTFYSIMELPRVNGKRRYKRLSLYTSNYYEAREKIKQMAVIFDKEIEKELRLRVNASPFCITEKEVIKIRDELIEEYNRKYAASHPKNQIENKEQNQSILKEYIDKIISSVEQKKTAIPTYTIQEIIDAMLLKANTKKDTNRRKINALNKIFTVVNMTPKSLYADFHDVKIIQTITQHIINENDVSGKHKRMQLSYIKEFVRCAHNMYSSAFPLNIILNMPNIKQKIKAENPHLPYSEKQLCEIFNPEHKFFDKNPDCFWICLIGLFTGARINAALTLQYADIIKENGIDCIYFHSNHPVKNLKNEASERKVPIHKQLLDLGFIDYIERKQKRLKARADDFIYPQAITKSGTYNNKFTVRVLTPFLKEIGVKTADKDGYDFHSFRKTASITMQTSKIPNSYINSIIGWEGKDTMEQSYSNFTLKQIKEEMDTHEYDFLKDHFAKWKEIMAKK